MGETTAAEKTLEEKIQEAQKAYEVQKSFDNQLYKNKREQYRAEIANELTRTKAKEAAYMAEKKRLEESGEAESDNYKNVIAGLQATAKEAENIGKGNHWDGKKGGFWNKLTSISKEDIKALKTEAFSVATTVSNAYFDAEQKANQRDLAKKKKKIDKEYKAEAKLLDDKRSKGLITEKRYQLEMEKLNQKKAEQEEEADRESFEREKRLNVNKALVNGALAVGKAFAMWGWPLGLVFAALAAAQCAAQVAIIKSQKYALGGLLSLGGGMGVVRGRSHAQGGHQLALDGMPIGEVEGDELLAIVNKHDTARIGALSAANSVHGRRFAEGGLLRGPVDFSSVQAQHEAASLGQLSGAVEMIRDGIRATNERIDRLKVVLVTQEVTEAQKQIKKIEMKQTW